MSEIKIETEPGSFGCLKILIWRELPVHPPVICDMWSHTCDMWYVTSPSTRTTALARHVIAVATVPAKHRLQYFAVSQNVSGSRVVTPATALAHATSAKSSWNKKKEKQQFWKVFTELKTIVWNLATFYRTQWNWTSCALRSIDVILFCGNW